MLAKLLICVLASVLVGAATLWAQGRDFVPPIGGPQTLFEQFAHRLDLDRRTQFQEAERLFTEASRAAPPIAQQMQQLRIRLVNAEIEKNETEIKVITGEYRAAAARMAGLEAETFGKVYALLRPNQVNHAMEAFALLAGVFVPPPPATARVPRR
jgi:hypothetical protein